MNFAKRFLTALVLLFLLFAPLAIAYVSGVIHSAHKVLSVALLLIDFPLTLVAVVLLFDLVDWLAGEL